MTHGPCRRPPMRAHCPPFPPPSETPPMRLSLLACVLSLAALIAAPAFAQSSNDEDEKLVVSSEGFLSAHPDLRHRLAGLRAYNKGDFKGAYERFRRAARFADKPSQGMVAEMLWEGQGVARDKALAYVWMDLAAERQYPLMLVKRERYWNELDEAERARALELGEAIYAEFGDEVGKRRLDRELRQAKRQSTGSRLGSVGALKIQIPTPSGYQIIDGSTYYDPKFWDIDQYIEWHDGDWTYYAEGTVDVGEVMSAEDAAADAAAEAAYEAEEARQSDED